MLLNQQAYLIQLRGLKILKKNKVHFMSKKQRKLNAGKPLGVPPFTRQDKINKAASEANKIKQKLISLDVARDFVNGVLRKKISLNNVFPMISDVIQMVDNILGFTHEERELSWILLCLRSYEIYEKDQVSSYPKHSRIMKLPAESIEYLKTGVTSQHKHNAVILWMYESRDQNWNKQNTTNE